MIREAIRTTVRGVGVVLLTGVEVTALSVWLGLVGDAAGSSAVALVGVAALAAGLLVTGLLAHVTVNGWSRPVPARSVVGLALAQTVLLVGWLATVGTTDSLVEVAGVGIALALALVPRHTVADNAVRGRNPLSSLVGRTTAGLAVLDAAGLTAWLLVATGRVYFPEWVVVSPVAGFSGHAVIGGALLAGVVFARHLLAVRYALRPGQTRREAGWRSSRGTPRE